MGFAFVSSITNTYNTGILTQASGTGSMALGGIVGQVAFTSDFYNMATESSGKDIWGTLGKVFKLVSNFNVGDIFKLGESFAGGLVGYLDIWDGDNSEIEMSNNWWSNNIDKAIGYMDGISVFTNDQLVGKIDKEGILEGFKTYTHKVYNSDPSWDFNTIWSNVYNGKDYPVLAFQYMLPPQKPTVNRKVGTYTSNVLVSLSSVGSSKIIYTLDGSTPTCILGKVYSSPLSLSKTTTIKAIGCDSGNLSSDLGVFKYTILGFRTVISSDSETNTGDNGNEETQDNSTPVNNGSVVSNVETKVNSNGFNFNWLWLLLIPILGGGYIIYMKRKKDR